MTAQLGKDYESILVEQDGPVGIVTLNRPDQLNSWDWLMSAEMNDAFGRFDNDDDVRAIDAKLDRLDRASSHGPWTMRTLALIRQHPQRRAPDLAEMEGRETVSFKIDVRKLKAMGLTVSFPVGYEISARGAAYLARTTRTP